MIAEFRREMTGKREIDRNLETSELILLLVSPDFLASDYCYEVEMRRALERNNAGEASVVPIIIRDCQWQHADFAKLQVLPRDAKPVRLWTDRDSAWSDVAKGIEVVITDFARSNPGGRALRISVPSVRA